MGLHRVYLPLAPLAPGPLEVTGDEAQHAVRVKRLEVNDSFEVLNGAGVVARARVAASAKERSQWVLRAEIIDIARTDPVAPRVHVRSAVPKGPRVADLIDGLAQVGAASWGPLHTSRGVHHGARPERLERAAMEASKQCGRAWALGLDSESTLERALEPSPGVGIVLADAQGAPYAPAGAGEVRLLIGPEGGWTAQEIAAARRAGALIARFAPHTMRIETAAVVACACVLHAEQSR